VTGGGGEGGWGWCLGGGWGGGWEGLGRWVWWGTRLFVSCWVSGDHFCGVGVSVLGLRGPRAGEGG